MDDYDTCFERAADKPAFSNGTEGVRMLKPVPSGVPAEVAA